MEFIIAVFISFGVITYTKRNLFNAFFIGLIIYAAIYALMLYQAQKKVFPIGSLHWGKGFSTSFILLEGLAGYVIPFILIAFFYKKLTKATETKTLKEDIQTPL
jgi:predicted membrane protein